MNRVKINSDFCIAAVLLITVFLCGCMNLVSEYDLYTYRNLTELKGEMKITFAEFAGKGASGETDFKLLKKYHIRISQAAEYEKGKKLNDHTSAQFEILEDTIKDVIKRFNENNSSLSKGYSKAKWMVLEKAFDLAIETERNKINT